MRRIILICFFLGLFLIVKGQSGNNHLTGGEDSAAKRAIGSFSATPEVLGFRVCIFSGSEQDARNNAKQNLELSQTAFPDVKGEIVYEAPIFKVLVGACINRIEAIKLLSRLKGTFPKAFIISCQIPIDSFLKQETQSQVSDSLAVIKIF